MGGPLRLRCHICTNDPTCIIIPNESMSAELYRLSPTDGTFIELNRGQMVISVSEVTAFWIEVDCLCVQLRGAAATIKWHLDSMDDMVALKSAVRRLKNAPTAVKWDTRLGQK